MDRKIIFVDAYKWQTTTYVTAVVIFLLALKPSGGRRVMKKHQRECAESENTVSYLYCGAQEGTCQPDLIHNQPKQFGVKPGVGYLLLTRKFHSE